MVGEPVVASEYFEMSVLERKAAVVAGIVAERILAAVSDARGS